MARTKNDQLFIRNSSADNSTIKERFISEIVDEYKCIKCGIDEWQGEDIVLQMDHINGDHTNNEISNLRLLCPNCHSQTETFAGRNLWQKKDISDEILINAVITSKSIKQALKKVGLNSKRMDNFARVNKLILTGKAELKQTTFKSLFGW